VLLYILQGWRPAVIECPTYNHSGTFVRRARRAALRMRGRCGQARCCWTCRQAAVAARPPRGWRLRPRRRCCAAWTRCAASPAARGLTMAACRKQHGSVAQDWCPDGSAGVGQYSGDTMCLGAPRQQCGLVVASSYVTAGHVAFCGRWPSPRHTLHSCGRWHAVRQPTERRCGCTSGGLAQPSKRRFE